MKGLIVMNGYPAAEKFYRQSERIKTALEGLGVKTDIFLNGEVKAFLSEDGTAKAAVSEYAFCVYLDKDKYLSRILEGAGLRLFNSAQAIELCDDKMITYLALQGAGVKIPKTISAPLCYTQGSTPLQAFLDEVEGLNYPLVAKKSYGSFGAGVKLIENRAQLEQTEQEWLYLPHFYQSFVGEKGRDIRVVVIGGRAVAGMRRIACEGEFRSNIELGGRGEGIDLPKAYAEAAERVAQHLKLDYCGVDLLEGAEPIVCEVNSNAFFEGLEQATGVNIAEKYAEYIVNEMK